jgi:hypothetical protein
MQSENSQKTTRNLVIVTPARFVHLESETYRVTRPVNPLLSNTKVCEGMDRVWKRYGNDIRPPRKSFGIKYKGMAYRGCRQATKNAQFSR